MMVVPNQIVFTEENYGNSRKEMFAAVAQQLDVLFKNNYICMVREEDFGIIVIEFEHDNRIVDYGSPRPCWLTSEELWELETMREDENNVDDE